MKLVKKELRKWIGNYVSEVVIKLNNGIKGLNLNNTVNFS
jgi:hypothetical protein